MLFLYQLGLLAFAVIYLPLRFLRGRGRLPGLRERLALYPARQRKALAQLRRPIWLHVVSVGEVMAARPLVEQLRRRFPDRDWVISTVTPTGRTVAEKLIRGPQDQLIYLPWDFSPGMRQAIRLLRPRLFISFETELWPVLFHELRASGVPVAVVNGRISPSAYRRYLWVRPWMERVLAPVQMFFLQSAQDARRYAALGAAKDRLVVTGNVKWDLSFTEKLNGSAPEAIRSRLALSPGTAIWCAGSTHSGEERLNLWAYRRIRRKHPNLKLVLAPRHPERVTEVEQVVSSLSLSSARWSRLKEGKQEKGEILLVDTLGELASFYAVSDLVFVGGSLVPHGGHNLVEPAIWSRPILTGPHLHNFQAISEILIQAGGVMVVRSAQELEERIGRLLRDPAIGQEMGRRANALLEQNRGATLRSAEYLSIRWGKILAES